MRPSGVYVATVTPFDRDGRVSVTRYRAHLEFLASRGVQGFVPCGTTGEGSTLDSNERRQLIACAREVASTHGLSVIAGCGSNCTTTALEYIHEAKAMGCEAALIVTPYYNKPTPAGLLAHYRFLADEGGLPIVLYNVPGRTNVFLSVELTLELLAHPNIIGIKEASGNFGHWMQLATAFPADKVLLAGDDDALTTIQALGGCGIISASANVVPDLFVHLYELGRTGKWEDAFRLQKRLFPLVRAMFSETNPAPAKYALEVLGHGDGNLRLPLVPVSPATEITIRTALKSLELLQ